MVIRATRVPERSNSSVRTLIREPTFSPSDNSFDHAWRSIVKRSIIPISMLTLFLSICLAVFAQQAGAISDDEASIKQHRAEIQKLAAKTPPPETKAAHDQTLAQLRRELRDLLLQKKGALKKDIQDLQTSNASA